MRACIVVAAATEPTRGGRVNDRAIDNQVFVAGVAPARDETAAYVAWGHSTLVSPWYAGRMHEPPPVGRPTGTRGPSPTENRGQVVATTGHEPAIVYADIGACAGTAGVDVDAHGQNVEGWKGRHARLCRSPPGAGGAAADSGTTPAAPRPVPADMANGGRRVADGAAFCCGYESGRRLAAYCWYVTVTFSDR